MKYLCSYPTHDPDAWTEVETYDRETAAEQFATGLCERQPALYAGFEHDGGIVLVKVAGGAARAFAVTMDLQPHFVARARL